MSSVQAMTSVETVCPSALDEEARSLWRSFQSADPSLASPYFSLGFLDALDAARRDTPWRLFARKA
ncbi:hypothetical protein [Glycocaulis sp.]